MSPMHPQLQPANVWRLNEPLAQKTTLRVGGCAQYYAEPASIADLKILIQWAMQHQIPWFILGRGSNILVLDEGYSGLVVRLNQPAFHTIEQLDNQHLRAGAGIRLKELCGQAACLGWSGFEFLEGIPGSVGGALRMNAGDMGSWMFDRVVSIECLDPHTGNIQTYAQDALTVGYRSCEHLKNQIALSAILQSTGQQDKETIQATMASMAAQRKASQPKQSSAGCMFKNPDTGYAGQLIDACGLKGMQEGQACISTIHGNFVINLGDATARDVIGLVRKIRQTVAHQKQTWLNPEVVILGQSWDQVL